MDEIVCAIHPFACHFGPDGLPIHHTSRRIGQIHTDVSTPNPACPLRNRDFVPRAATRIASPGRERDRSADGKTRNGNGITVRAGKNGGGKCHERTAVERKWSML